MSDTKKRFISRTCKVQIPPDLVVNHNQLVLLTLFYTLSSVQTVFTWHVASGNQGVSCSRQLKSSGLPLNQMECGNIDADDVTAELLGQIVRGPPGPATHIQDGRPSHAPSPTHQVHDLVWCQQALLPAWLPWVHSALAMSPPPPTPAPGA